VSDAADKYPIHRRDTILEWVRRGHIRILEPSSGRGSRMYLDEADVAYCAIIHATRQKAEVYAGVPLLDAEGRLYLLRHP
jgi:predicted site-specific integrase-resolvase